MHGWERKRLKEKGDNTEGQDRQAVPVQTHQERAGMCGKTDRWWLGRHGKLAVARNERSDGKRFCGNLT